jgi:hypothetical protein
MTLCFHPVPDAHQIRLFLDSAGYGIVYREQEWIECLLVRGEAERWVGRGDDHDTALLHALGQAFPSEAARTALMTALLVARHGPGTEAMAEADPATDVPLPRCPAVSGDGGEQPAGGARPGAGAPAAASPLTAADGDGDGGRREDGVPPPSDHLIEVLGSGARADHRPPAAMPLPPLDTRAALVRLRELRQRILADEPDVAVLAPGRQRLILLGWIAQARSYQEDLPELGSVHCAVQEIAHLLGGLARTWWPGSVSALQLRAQPAQALALLRLTATQTPTSWKQVADLAEQELHAVEERDEADGLDDRGWGDEALLDPPPDDPDGLLEDILTAMGPDGELPELRQVMQWARSIRWLRGSVRQVDQWASVLGLLRRWIQEYPDLACAARLLEPEYRPNRQWAEVFRHEAANARREREAAEVLTDAPTADRPIGPDGLREWLFRALPYTDTRHEAVVAAMTPFAGQVLLMESAGLPSRRLRRRLLKLQEALRQETAPSPQTRSTHDLTHMAHAGAGAPGSIRHDDGDRIRRRVLQLTRDKRALFVGNRSDPELRQRLVELFGLADLAWAGSEPRRVDGAVQAIAGGAYDIVFCATGFLEHKVSSKLIDACRATDVRFYRVNRGRPLTCLLAVARDCAVAPVHARQLDPDPAVGAVGSVH